jgi:hypothetical protein
MPVETSPTVTNIPTAAQTATVKTIMRQQAADTNIDRHHCDTMNKHRIAIQVRIPRLKLEQATLREKFKTMSTESRPETAARIRDIKKEITQIKHEYSDYVNTSTLPVFRYYEDKQQISTGTNQLNQQSVLNFFNTSEEEGPVEPTIDSIGVGVREELRSHPLDAGPSSRRLYQQYWKCADGKIVYAQDFSLDTSTCMSCNIGELIPQDDEGILVCNNINCGKYIAHIVDSQKASHTEIPNEISYSAYVRLNHFKEILSQFQAKQSTVIPQSIIDRITARMKKERMTKADICYGQMRHILTVLGLSKYFEHIQHINAIFGVKPPLMDPELYNTMVVLFIEIQEPWAMCCPPDRVNFFNYTYVVYQLFVLLDQTQFWKYTSVAADRILKSYEKRAIQDETWKAVCKKLGWAYFPTS